MIENEFKDYEVITTVGATPKEIEPYKVFKQTMTADDILSGKKFPGRKIVIIGGGSVGCETADYLAPLINDLFPTNRDITLIEMTKGLMTGESGATKSLLTRRMMEKGVYVVAFSYPVVPKGKARIRTQVCASHTKEDIDFIVKCFIEVREEMGLNK